MQKVLTKAEEQIMQVVWRLEKSGLKEITDGMPDPKPHTNTVATLLKILHEKGFIGIEPIGRVNRYYPLLSREEYSGNRINNIVSSYFDGSFSNVISFLVKNKNVSVEDLELLIKKSKNNADL